MGYIYTYWSVSKKLKNAPINITLLAFYIKLYLD